MATIKSGILGGLSGKVGNVVGSSWKGISYLRSLPSHVTDANTLAQRTSRMKMRLVMQFLKTCTPLVRVGFNGYAVKMSAFNAATSYNYHHGITGVYPDLALDYSSLLITRGNLAGGEGVSVAVPEPGKVTVNWIDNSGTGNAQPGDTALLLVYNPVKGAAVFRMQGNSRLDGGATVDLPASLGGDELHCFLGFADFTRLGNRDSVSNSLYAGSVLA